MPGWQAKCLWVWIVLVAGVNIIKVEGQSSESTVDVTSRVVDGVVVVPESRWPLTLIAFRDDIWDDVVTVLTWVDEVEWPAVIRWSLVSTVVVQRRLRHSESGVDWVELVNAANQGRDTKLVDDRWSRELAVVQPHVRIREIAVEAVLAFSLDQFECLWSAPGIAAIFKSLALNGQCFVECARDWELIHEWRQHDWCATLCGNALH